MEERNKFRIGSRESRLAVIQSEMLKQFLEEQGIEAEIIGMKTTGDRILDKPLTMFGGKGVFVKELDRALLEDRSDVSVHSLKDVPIQVPESLPLLGFSKREDPRDVLVLPIGEKKPDFGKPIGCSSKRRILQAKRLFPAMSFASVRGNVLTRLRRLDVGEYSALILAAAGLKRLGLTERISRYFEVEEMIPSGGQGILAVQGKAGKEYSFLHGFFDETAEIEAVCERAFVRRLNGGCTAPVAVHARYRNGRIKVCGMYGSEKDGQSYVTEMWEKPVPQHRDTKEWAAWLGGRLAETLKEKAAQMIFTDREERDE